MTQEQYDKAKALIEKRDYYNVLAHEVMFARDKKLALDEKAKTDMTDHNNRWTLSKFFTIKLLNNKETNRAIVRVMPHWEFAHSIDIEVEPELIDLIIDWLLSKTAELENQIEKI